MRKVFSHSQVSHRKAKGIHYTPVLLARFLAKRLVGHLPRSSAGAPLRILDPACGEGELLEAFLHVLAERDADICEVVGVDTDAEALAIARTRLERFSQIRFSLVHGDFLDLASGGKAQPDFWADSSQSVPALDQLFDIVVANPPYVRTQVLGAEKAQRLAERFGLTGRVDLYHAFLVASTEMLRPSGVLSVITSNRFLTTLGGATIRSYLTRHYAVCEVIDLGDTKLFEAAVLPAIFIGRRLPSASPGKSSEPARFLKIYAQSEGDSQRCEEALVVKSSLFDALESGSGFYQVAKGVFKVTCGDLVLDRNPTRVWALTTTRETAWLDGLRSSAAGVFGDVASIRVGIKTTADEVFIRSHWEALASDMRPESSLLRPLLRHEDVRRWRLPPGSRPGTSILYPHEVVAGQRRAVDLRNYPRTRAYLELYRERLQGRKYVRDAGRRWYEIWVPQDPNAWERPKIVFPDISAEPLFYVETEGWLVDGDCYWLTLRPQVCDDMLYLLLAVANSSVMVRFHDLAFNNKLYSGRRRYITQYVAQYPYPDPNSSVSRKIVELVKRGLIEKGTIEEKTHHAHFHLQLNTLVAEAFGVNLDEAM